MPRPRQTDAEIEAMRERILDAADEILRDDGPDGLTVRAIADKVGLSHMTLYTYYANHGEMMAALRERADRRMQQAHEELIAAAQAGQAIAAMRDTLGHFAEVERLRPRMFRFVWVVPTFEACPGGRHHRAHHHHHRPEMFTVAHAHVARLIRIGIDQGVFLPRDPEVASAVALGMVLSPLILHSSGRLASETLRDAAAAESVTAALSYLTGKMAGALPMTKSEVANR